MPHGGSSCHWDGRRITLDWKVKYLRLLREREPGVACGVEARTTSTVMREQKPTWTQHTQQSKIESVISTHAGSPSPMMGPLCTYCRAGNGPCFLGAMRKGFWPSWKCFPLREFAITIRLGSFLWPNPVSLSNYIQFNLKKNKNSHVWNYQSKSDVISLFWLPFRGLFWVKYARSLFDFEDVVGGHSKALASGLGFHTELVNMETINHLIWLMSTRSPPCILSPVSITWFSFCF